jgi:hypothetical protein
MLTELNYSDARTDRAEQVITLASARDRQRLRAKLLQVILQSESRRTGRRIDVANQEPSPTEGPAAPSSQAHQR